MAFFGRVRPRCAQAWGAQPLSPQSLPRFLPSSPDQSEPSLGLDLNLEENKDIQTTPPREQNCWGSESKTLLDKFTNLPPPPRPSKKIIKYPCRLYFAIFLYFGLVCGEKGE